MPQSSLQQGIRQPSCVRAAPICSRCWPQLVVPWPNWGRGGKGRAGTRAGRGGRGGAPPTTMLKPLITMKRWSPSRAPIACSARASTTLDCSLVRAPCAPAPAPSPFCFAPLDARRTLTPCVHASSAQLTPTALERPWILGEPCHAHCAKARDSSQAAC